MNNSRSYFVWFLFFSLYLCVQCVLVIVGACENSFRKRNERPWRPIQANWWLNTSWDLDFCCFSQSNLFTVSRRRVNCCCLECAHFGYIVSLCWRKKCSMWLWLVGWFLINWMKYGQFIYDILVVVEVFFLLLWINCCGVLYCVFCLMNLMSCIQILIE